MNKDKIKCECKKIFDNKEFIKHYRNCLYFRKKFDKFDFKINMLIREFITKKEDYLLIKMILKGYIHIMNKMINNIDNNENSEKDQKLIENKIYNENEIKNEED